MLFCFGILDFLLRNIESRHSSQSHKWVFFTLLQGAFGRSHFWGQDFRSGPKAPDATPSRWLFYTMPIPWRFLTKPRHALPFVVWLWGWPFRSCNCPCIEAAWVRLSPFSEKLQGPWAKHIQKSSGWMGREDSFRNRKCVRLAYGSLAYFTRNSVTRPSLGQHEKQFFLYTKKAKDRMWTSQNLLLVEVLHGFTKPRQCLTAWKIISYLRVKS